MDTPNGAMTTEEMREQFDVIGFAAGFGVNLVVVRRKSDGIRGTLEFTHAPRYYFGFQAAE